MLSAELNWLPRSLFKGIKYPKVVYEEPNNQNYSGFYTLYTNTLTIVTSEVEDSTIAHEFWHYLQFLKYGKLPSSKFSIKTTYEQAIYDYFTNNPFELEALLFEYKQAKNWLNSWWLRGIVRI